MNRVTFLIDGFNLYHSVVQASFDLGLKGKGTRWLNVWSLCSSYLHAIGGNAQIKQVYYFSAFATHREHVSPDTVQRHKEYIECLRETGVVPEMGRFKKKQGRCYHCNRQLEHHEEKETDVAIATKLLEVALLKQCDTAVIVTGDTDVAPSVRTTQRLFPTFQIHFLFPYQRKNKELADLASRSFNIKRETYVRHQFPNPVVLSDGRQVHRPAKW